tara:strand:- start:358 stop:750 length:393 start_codon:yes stop_codon:yes gene_type:complete
MRVYTVYEQAGDTRFDGNQGIILIKEGFCWPAAIIPLFWLLYRRLWLPALAVVLLLGVAVVASTLFYGSEPYTVLSLVALSVVLGAEGNNLRQYFLISRGYSFVGVVVGRNEPEAEMRLFSIRGQRIYVP